MEKSYKAYLSQISTFVFDVDGVFTDGKVLVTSEGDLLRAMNIMDGYAVKTAIQKKYNICIITGGTNEGVRKRLKGLGVQEVHLGAHNKVEVLNDFLKKKEIPAAHVLYMGDDIPDIPAMQEVILPCAPQNAAPEVKAISKYISHRNGGEGCVRDVIEQVLKVRGDWYQNFSAAND
ncbi:KdsC family phosphatase [Muriicola soli]|uniref:3-deoxy-D-manno-octulosonate 8-phosphate phosphatase n=1 Tax=Muriicola soli TaxID=2507538 RepID=A0A411E8D7_9FLAO|nr:HAD hydrolase family protein [Muriicola soli]QBA63942.1 3-deoxy-D-manno-octulosonate 8-phosphate phosphatase [Muriicola soli]